MDARQVGHDLGVRYMLEGSVRKSGDRVRVTAQLIDTQNGSHIWAERYDRSLDDIFAIQDDITREIVVSMAVNLTHGEEMRLWSDFNPSLEGWELSMRGLAEQYKFTKEGLHEAERLHRRASEFGPRFKLGVGWSLLLSIRYGGQEDPMAATTESLSICEELLAMDSTFADAHCLLGYIEVNRRNFDAALVACKRAVELEPRRLAVSRNSGIGA